MTTCQRGRYTCRTTNLYYWHGHPVDEGVILNPDSIPLSDLIKSVTPRGPRFGNFAILDRIGGIPALVGRKGVKLHRSDASGDLYEARYRREYYSREAVARFVIPKEAPERAFFVGNTHAVRPGTLIAQRIHKRLVEGS